jgi:hypothetical protein
MPPLYFLHNIHHTTVNRGSAFHYRKKIIGKVVPVHTMEAHKGSGGITPPILNLGTRFR